MDNREFEKFKQAVFGQESGNGAVPTDKPNYAGALGKGQILEKTFEGLRKSGKIPADYQWTNPEHNEEASVAYMQEAWQAGGADPRKAAAYYYGGPKAIKGGQIVSYRDKLNPKAPDTLQYADQIAARMGITEGATPAQPSFASLKEAVQAANDSRRLDPNKFTPNYIALQLDTEGAVRKNSNTPGVLGYMGAAIAGNTDQRILRLFADEFPEEPGYKADFSKLPLGADRDLVEAYARTKSTLAADKVLRNFEDETTRQETIGRLGPVGGFALSLGGEVASATNWLTGFAASASLARTGYGSVQAMRSGNYAKGIASNVAENVLSGTVVEAALSSAENKFDLQSTGINLVADAFIGASVGGWGARSQSLKAGQDLINQTRAATFAKEVEYATRAEARLGPNATAEEVVAEVSKIKREEQLAIVPTNTARSSVFDIDRLVPEEAVPTQSVASLQNDLQTSTRFASESNALDEQVISTMNKRWAELRELGLALPDTLDGTVRASAIDALDTTPKVHIAASAQGSLKFAQYAEALEGLRRQFLPDVALHITDGKARLQGTNLGVHAIVKPNMSVIGLRTDSGVATAVHEFGHAVFAHRLAALPAEQKAAMESAWREWQTKYMKQGAAQEAILQRSPVNTSARRLPSGDETFAGKAAQGEFTQALADVWDDAFPGNQKAADAYARYFGNFDEYSAEQFAKFVEAEVAGLGQGKLTVPQQIVRALAYLLQQAAEIFKFAKAKNLVKPDAPFEDFFNDLLNGNASKGTQPLEIGDLQAMTTPAKSERDSNFAKWFGDSKVVDADGKPLVVYHGTTKDFAQFGPNTGWFTSSPSEANTFGGLDSTGANIIPAFLSIQNPRILDQSTATIGSVRDAVEALQRNEDGVLVMEGGKVRWAIVADPNQIKSATGNNGNFDAANPNMNQMTVPAAKPSSVANEFLTDPDALKYGLTTLPINTPAERKKAQAILALHKQADNWAVTNPKDAAWDKRAKNWADNDVFNVASTGLIMLKSENNLVRMMASELLEDASGVSGKKGSTAAITKYLVERRIMGNSLPEIEEAYGIWSANKKGSNLDNLSGGEYRKEFNRSVFELVERQGKGENITADTPENAALLKAASVVQATFKRSATEQINANTLGSGALEDGVGYMPHKINPKMVMALTNEQTRVLHSALTDQFITIEGWDTSFSDMLASKYLERVQRRAHGDYSSSVGGNSADTADLVRETLMGMNLPEQIVADHMARFTKGAANFTKKRLDLDLHRVYDVDGKAFKLLDVFETDPIALMRSQAQRASGDVALASKGIKGKPGMQLMREAMRYGETGKKATDAEFGAFDQTAAEFFGDPFGTQSTRWMERAMSANTLIRLGGMGFNQLSEALNGVFHVGALRTFDSITSIPRLKAEIDALVRGEKVDNPIIGSIEAAGTEFGVDSHRVVLPYDSPDHAYPTYGQDTLTMTDRLLRGGGYLQAKLSGWRLIHSTQQRGMAEQITRKVMRYIKEGKEDEALKGFGVNDNLRAAIAADLDKIAVFDGSGGLTALDITKMTDPAVASELVQVIHRGVNQIIQGTFIGERGKWVHDGWLKLLTQFRSFSITSMEKQWGRQRNSHGVFAAAGMLLGAMSMAAPIYMARVYAASVGREDQQEYLEKRLTPQGIAKGTMNYVAMSGLFGDFADLLTAVAPDKVREATGLQPTGARVGTESEFIGTFLAPSAGLVDDAWKYLQSPDDLKEGAKLLPFGRLPYLIPLLNTIPKPDRD